MRNIHRSTISAVRLTIATILVTSLLAVACGGDEADPTPTPLPQGLTGFAQTREATPPETATKGTLTGGSGRGDVTVMTADGTLVKFSISGSRTALTGVVRDDIKDGLKVSVTGPPGGEATSLTVIP